MIPFWWKVFVMLAMGKPFFENSEGILRNAVTDRCLHLGYNQVIKKDGFSVYVNQCTFTDIQTGKQGNRDQWVEVVPINPSKDHQYLIKKFDDYDHLCVRAENNLINVGDCDSPNSIFHFKPLENITSSSNQVFTIEQPSLGKCITVEPGHEKLKLKNCSDTNPFQRWTACRHIDACDIEVSWSPGRIIFPKDPFNKSSDFQEPSISVLEPMAQTIPSVSNIVTPEIETSAKSIAPTTTTTTTESLIDETDKIASPSSHIKVIVNEPLYFIYNSLNISTLSQSELVKITSEFYEKRELDEALAILREEFALEINPRTRALKKALQLVNWIKQITAHGLNSDVIFASKNMQRVPMPSLSANRNSKTSCPNVQVVKDKIQTQFDTMSQTVISLKSNVLSELDEMIKASQTSDMIRTSTRKPDEESSLEDNSDSEEDITNIDVRLSGSKRKPSYSHNSPKPSLLM